MNWPSYGRNVLRPVLRGALRDLTPEPSRILLIQDRRAETATSKALNTVLGPYKDRVVRVPIWPTEERKSFSEAERICRKAMKSGVDRESVVLAVGGGITSDLAGFVAAVLLRGVRWGAVPTTLLGMVDAALGGKTAVNLPEGKNLAGAFHPPEFVICDLNTLRSLPPREWRCGLGEVIKSALIGDPDMLILLEEARAADLIKPSKVSLAVAQSTGELKMRIVDADPDERGDRKVLNLGHTFGHALETAAGQKKLAHGEAVAIGLLCAMRMAEELGVAEPGVSRRVRRIMQEVGLPTRYPGELPSRKRLTTLIKRDKKARNGRLDLVLPVKPGECLLVKGVEPAVAVAALHRELGT